MPKKVVHYNWIYQTLREGIWQNVEATEKQKRVIAAVQSEIAKLTELEQEFIRMYWFEGMSTAQISDLLGKKVYKLEGMSRRIQRKLKNRLSEFVSREFDVESGSSKKCLICSSQYRAQIDQMLKSKKPEQTYKHIIKTLKNDFGITVKTPQIIIGHQKYHIWED